MTVSDLATSFEPRRHFMPYRKKRTLIIMVITVLLMTAMATPALAQNPVSNISGEGMAADFLVLRPLGLAVTAVGCAFYVASFPFTIWSEKNRNNAIHHFIAVPASYTFVRPLGEVENVSNGY